MVVVVVVEVDVEVVEVVVLVEVDVVDVDVEVVLLVELVVLVVVGGGVQQAPYPSIVYTAVPGIKDPLFKHPTITSGPLEALYTWRLS